ncbi:Phosphatidylglycerol/phosphatidylinositol transfer protein [Quaeritorhiza haematococci]|nr:Phosphatidylglycerol/phosphatidylinositol transfer protein [Quaeritorhiza haematococci]
MGVIKLLDIGLDLCEELKYVGRECPLKEGPLELSHDLDIPNEIPPGKFTVTIHVDTPQNDEITCISARLQF